MCWEILGSRMRGQKRPFAGGCRQFIKRVNAEAEVSASSAGSTASFGQRLASAASSLATYCIGQFVWGEKTGKDVKCTCLAAVNDGADQPDVVALSRLREDHEHGELLAKLKPSPYKDCLIEFDMPFQTADHMGYEFHKQSLLPPHALFAGLYEHQPDQFLQRICGGSYGNISQFWDDMQGNPQLEENTDLKARSNYRTHALPLSIHGDGLSLVGVKKTWQKSADVYSWCSCLGKGSVGYPER